MNKNDILLLKFYRYSLFLRLSPHTKLLQNMFTSV